MFRKKECKKCGNKVNKKYDFCPYCGNPIEYEKEDFGMLGKNDIREFDIQNPLFGGITENILSKMLGSAMKMLEKEMNQKKNNSSKTNVRLMINGKEISLNQTEKKQKKIKEAESKFFSKQKTKTFLSLKKEEPNTNIRRLSGKVIYEIEMKDVSSAEDISIIKLENSVEIRAIANKKAYFKIIPINLPMISYEFLEGRLVLELKD